MTWVYNFGSGNADGRAEMKQPGQRQGSYPQRGQSLVKPSNPETRDMHMSFSLNSLKGVI